MRSKATRGRKRLDMLSEFKTTTEYVEVKTRAAEERVCGVQRRNGSQNSAVLEQQKTKRICTI